MQGWLTPNTPGGNTVRRFLVIPVEFVSQVNGALYELAQPWNWEAYGDLTPAEAAGIMSLVVEDYFVGRDGDINGRDIVVPVWMGTGTIGTPAWTTNNSAIGGGYWSLMSPAVHNYYSWPIWLNVGTWDLYAIYATGPNCGIAQWTGDGVNIGSSIDTYAATTALNIKVLVGSLVVSDAGQKDIRVTADTKNASSSSYQIRTSAVYLRRQP